MEVARHWRLGKQRKNPQLESCNNCDEVSMVIGRPVCKNCGLVFKPEKTESVEALTVNTHTVIGKNMRVYFNEANLSNSSEDKYERIEGTIFEVRVIENQSV